MAGYQDSQVLERLDHMSNQLNALTNAIENITATLANHTQQLIHLNDGLQGVNQRLAELTGQHAAATRRITLAVNTNAISRPTHAAFVPFPFANNVMHPGFPPTVRDLERMTGPQMTALLNANGIYEIPNELEARRVRVETLITTAL